MTGFNFKKIPAAILSILLAAESIGAADRCILKEGVISVCPESAALKIILNGPVISFSESGDAAYFVRSENPQDNTVENDPAYYAGAVFKNKTVEVLLDKHEGYAPVKMLASDGLVYVLLKKTNSSDGYLQSVNLNRENISETSNVADFDIFNGKPVLLVVNKKSYLSLAGMKIPLSHADIDSKITINGGIAVIRGSETTEFVDLAALRSVYIYPNEGRFVKADSAGHNLILSLSDAATEDEPLADTVFYKIFINGAESGRTETAPAEIPLEFKVKVAPGKYHQIKIERWNLNRAKKKYERENNIKQPRTLTVYQPDDVVLKIQYRYVNRKYEAVSSILKEKN